MFKGGLKRVLIGPQSALQTLDEAGHRVNCEDSSVEVWGCRGEMNCPELEQSHGVIRHDVVGWFGEQTLLGTGQFVGGECHGIVRCLIGGHLRYATDPTTEASEFRACSEAPPGHPSRHKGENQRSAIRSTRQESVRQRRPRFLVALDSPQEHRNREMPIAQE